MSVINNFIDRDESLRLFEKLKNEVPWQGGIKTRNGHISRLQCHLAICPFDVQYDIMSVITKIFKSDSISKYVIHGIYLNYYRDGNDYCPSHNHDTNQCIISLGSTRKLKINNVDYSLETGSLVLFKNEYHSVQKEPNVGPRISIAIFFSKD